MRKIAIRIFREPLKYIFHGFLKLNETARKPHFTDYLIITVENSCGKFSSIRGSLNNEDG